MQYAGDSLDDASALYTASEEPQQNAADTKVEDYELEDLDVTEELTRSANLQQPTRSNSFDEILSKAHELYDVGISIPEPTIAPPRPALQRQGGRPRTYPLERHGGSTEVKHEEIEMIPAAEVYQRPPLGASSKVVPQESEHGARPVKARKDASTPTKPSGMLGKAWSAIGTFVNDTLVGYEESMGLSKTSGVGWGGHLDRP
ncbi:Hypothetical predicted protein [Lecanosticta acicola]|uniref:Uncharacterized protein n=1 Tax=Lecanosticta acicola TaxID=111012 RepID=A0AAI8Z6Z0_9PEZI|nr:Hypothetical predicted protein [Lecanosticta acicola]